MKTSVAAIIVSCAVAVCASGAQAAAVIRHVTVYSEPGRFGGWPANHGIWSWGNEILVGFSAAYFQWNDQDRHPYDRTRPEESRLARSLDGGAAWDVGYTRTVQRPDGRIVTLYYWASELRKERTIEATIWDPGR